MVPLKMRKGMTSFKGLLPYCSSLSWERTHRDSHQCGGGKKVILIPVSKCFCRLVESNRLLLMVQCQPLQKGKWDGVVVTDFIPSDITDATAGDPENRPWEVARLAGFLSGTFCCRLERHSSRPHMSTELTQESVPYAIGRPGKK